VRHNTTPPKGKAKWGGNTPTHGLDHLQQCGPVCAAVPQRQAPESTAMAGTQRQAFAIAPAHAHMCSVYGEVLISHLLANVADIFSYI
jgi:hypothetical protein